jgi:hypothetical protein
MDLDLFIEAEQNGTFELEALERSLLEIKQTSFQYLYDLQKEAVNYKRFDFKMSDLTLDANTNKARTQTYPRRYIHHVADNFVSEKTRLLYKRSQYYKKELNVFQVANDPKIFTHLYLVFVDGKYYDTINLRCKEGVTEIIFDIQENKINPTGIPKDHFKKLRDKNADVTVFFLPNAAYGLYKTNPHVLKMYQNNLSLDRFNIVNSLNTDVQYITFVNNNDLLFSSVITDTGNSRDMLRFFPNNLRAFDSKYIHLNVFGFRNLLDQFNIPGNNKFFKLPLQDMPIPTENLIIFRNDAEGNKTFAHDIKVKLYYPNIYEVIGNTTNANLTIYAFYFDDTKSENELKYKNDMEKYQELFGNDIGRYVSNVIPESAKNYMPGDHTYNIKDLHESEDPRDTLFYKIDKLKTWIRENPELLKAYLRNQIKTFNGYLIDVAKVDLKSKLRYNNHREVDYDYEKKTFSEPRYVFILKNGVTDNYLDARFYVDGLLYVPDETYKDESYEYYYIPASLIKSNTMIEIEKFNEIEYQKVMTLNSPVLKEMIHPRSDWVFNATDVYIVDPEVNKYVDRSKFKIVINKNGLDIDIEPSSFKELQGDIGIKVIDANLLNRPLYVFIRRHVYFEEMEINDRDDVGTVFYFDSKTNYDVTNVRVFKNGRLLPQSLYDVDSDNKVNSKHFVTPKIRKEIGDKFVIDTSPFKYQIVFEQNGIPNNGFVDLRGIVNKPFDLKWYDVYLNGRRLSTSNVEVISPTLIFIKSVSTRRNLLILEKNRDEEYFSIGNEKTLNDTLWDTDNEFRTMLNNRPALPDTEKDIITELENVLQFEKMRLFLLLIQGEKLINPDDYQITVEERRRFPNMFDPTKDFFQIDPDENLEAITRMRVFPEYNRGY